MRNLKKIAKSKGIKLVWIAEQCDLKYETLRRYTNGARAKKPMQEKIAELVGVTVEDLYL